jgi:hypothetical protein
MSNEPIVAIGAYWDFCEYWYDPVTGEETLKIDGKLVDIADYPQFSAKWTKDE